jgi:hypothetical protein
VDIVLKNILNFALDTFSLSQRVEDVYLHLEAALGTLCTGGSANLSAAVTTPYMCTEHGVSDAYLSVYNDLYKQESGRPQFLPGSFHLSYDDIYAVFTGLLGAFLGAAALLIGSTLVFCFGLLCQRRRGRQPQLRRQNAMRRQRGPGGPVRLRLFVPCWTSRTRTPGGSSKVLSPAQDLQLRKVATVQEKSPSASVDGSSPGLGAHREPAEASVV